MSSSGLPPAGFARRAQLRRLATVLLGTAFTTPRARAQGTGPITILVSFAVGGASDFAARTLARHLAQHLGVQVDVVNRPGPIGDAALEGVPAAEALAKSPADGRTLLLGTASTVTIAPIQSTALPYDPSVDFAPVSLVAAIPFIVAVNKDLPATNVAELVGYLRAMTDRVAIASAGGTGHFAVMEFARRTGTRFRHVRYAANGPELTADLMSGKIQVAFDSLLLPNVVAGEVRAIAVTTQMPLPALPRVPTLSESGVPGYDVGSWIALFAKAGTPQAIVAQLSRGIGGALAEPELRRDMQSRGLIVRSSNPDQLAVFLREERNRFARAASHTGSAPP